MSFLLPPGLFPDDVEAEPAAELLPRPSDPSGLVATTACFTRIDVSWQHNAGTEDGCGIELRKEGEEFALVHTTAAGVTSYGNTGLESGSTYYFRAYAFNSGGNSGYSNEASATTHLGFSAVFSISDGLGDDHTYGIVIDSDGGKWFTTALGGLSYPDGNGSPSNKADDAWQVVTTADGLAHDYLRAIAIDSSGGKWLATFSAPGGPHCR